MTYPLDIFYELKFTIWTKILLVVKWPQRQTNVKFGTYKEEIDKSL